MPVPIVQRPGLPATAGDHERRIRALERQRKPTGPASGFIRYDFLNVGDWLDIETTGADADGYGISLRPSGAFHLVCGDEIRLEDAHGLTIQSNGILMNTADGGGWIVGLGADGNWSFSTNQVSPTQGHVDWSVAGYFDAHMGEYCSLDSDGDFTISSDSGDVIIGCASGQTFEIRDSSGNPKIRWTEGTNDLHIPTGGTIVADL